MLERVTSDHDLYGLVEDFFSNSFSTDNALITEAVRRMLDAGGKRLRPRFALLGASALGAVDVREHLPLASYMELIHVATLIHDDVVDNADTRRGVNATAVDFGNRISVLAGDYLFAWIFKNVTADHPHPIPHILSATLADITDGEVLQLKALGNLDLGVEEYVEIAGKKTASLFAASAACGAIAGGAPANVVAAVRSFGYAYGIAFQMQDDYLDMTADEATVGVAQRAEVDDLRVVWRLDVLAVGALAAAEQAGEANLLGFLQRLPAENDDRGALPEPLELRDRIVVGHQVLDAFVDLDDEVGMQRPVLEFEGGV